MGFSRTQLVVVSGLFRWESLNGWDFLGHNLLLSQASFFTMEFWLWRSLSYEFSFFFHDGILAITKPFSRTFSFFTMEFWLSQSLFHELFFLFSRWNSGYHEAFLTNFFLFSRWNSGYHEAFLTNFLFFHDGILAITKPFSRTFFFFHDGILEVRDLGEDSFHIYIYITKSIYIGSASLKTLPLDLEPPLQGKEYGLYYSNATRKSKTNFLSRNHL
jgi:hypothetical protein